MTTIESYAKITHAEAAPRGLIGGAPMAHAEVEAERKYRREPGFPVPILIAPATLWLVVFLFLPLSQIFIFSFWKTTGHGMAPGFTLEHYRASSSPRAFSIRIASGFPDAVDFHPHAVDHVPLHHHGDGDLPDPRLSDCLFPVDAGARTSNGSSRCSCWSWCRSGPAISFARSPGCRCSGRHGLINEFLISIGAIDEPVSFFLYSEFSYTMALVQLYVVLAVGPIFFSLAKIDRTLLEAARDMGATPFQIFREIIAPLSLPGVAIGMIFIFVMVMGEFATAVVVYGGKTSTTGHRDPELLRHRQLSVRRGQRLHADAGDDDRRRRHLALVDIRKEL